MEKAQRTASGRYLDDLIALLDQERDTRHRAQRTELELALIALRDKASSGGASERTVGLIRAVQVMLALQAMPIGVDALQ
ncbi:hypothetical protein MKK64_00400 [Methylobacterium sp. E-025]|jgi:hypothetical protein|uniref:hypothetical protein n=1 Tax=unclassified Methylobacterium TaxID=2615210 RepID=UPI001FB97F7E|nr:MULTISPECIES: hypothetical protein [unclassified Methylobacterium]MCJ2039772.1 hypothetical protein [Methylobacterium sp. J-059]MCJ2109687.1 hypothetical protein [Methylobacterium sp. E-025]